MSLWSFQFWWGPHITMDCVLASHPAAPGLILRVPKNVSWDVAEIYWPALLLTGDRQKLYNFNWTHLVLASGKLALQNKDCLDSWTVQSWVFLPKLKRLFPKSQIGNRSISKIFIHLERCSFEKQQQQFRLRHRKMLPATNSCWGSYYKTSELWQSCAAHTS